MFNFSSFIDEATQKITDVLSDSLRKEIKSKEGKVYQIGGAVRDELIGKVSKDLDLLVTGIETDELQDLLSQHGKVDAVGKSFGILKFQPTGQSGEPLDISVPRVDVQSTGAGHKDFEVKLGKNISLEQDQLRRDFWMNAIAKDIETGEMHDIEGKGQFDIENKQISVINPKAFEDDPLRMLRAVQFASRFSFKIEASTMKEIKNNVAKIKTVSAERFQEEFRKLFEKSETPSVGLELLHETGIMDQILPRAKNDIMIHRIINKLDKKAFPAFLATIARDYEYGVGDVLQKTMKLSNADKQSARSVIEYAKNVKKFDDWFTVQYIQKKTEQDIMNIDEYAKAVNFQTVSQIIEKLKRQKIPTNLKELGINGRDLMREGFKGRTIGLAMNYIFELAVKEKIKNPGTLMRKAKEKFGIREEFFYEEKDGYYAVVLDASSRDKVEKLAQFEEIESDHVTIAYRPDDSIGDILDTQLGRSYNIITKLYVANDEIDALVVDVVGLKRQDPGPAHITISHKRGVEPKESNNLIRNPKYREKHIFKMRGILEFIAKK